MNIDPPADAGGVDSMSDETLLVPWVGRLGLRVRLVAQAVTRVKAMAIARACVEQPGAVIVTLNRVSHCGIVWSSNPTRIATEASPGWTRTGRCGKCDTDLVPFDEAP